MSCQKLHVALREIWAVFLVQYIVQSNTSESSTWKIWIWECWVLQSWINYKQRSTLPCWTQLNKVSHHNFKAFTHTVKVPLNLFYMTGAVGMVIEVLHLIYRCRQPVHLRNSLNKYTSLRRLHYPTVCMIACWVRSCDMHIIFCYRLRPNHAEGWTTTTWILENTWEHEERYTSGMRKHTLNFEIWQKMWESSENVQYIIITT